MWLVSYCWLPSRHDKIHEIIIVTGYRPIAVTARVRRGSAAALLLGLWVRIPPGHRCLPFAGVVCYQAEVSALADHFS